MARLQKRLLIAGPRGLANYGGFEAYIAGLAPRLASMGYSVTCSCEKSGRDPDRYGDVALHYFPLHPPRNASLRRLFEPLYDAYFILRSDYDIVYGLGCLGGLFYLFPRLLGKKSVVNVAGLEWRRGRFKRFESLLIRLLWVACTISASTVAVDNRQLTSYINPRYRGKVRFTPYGVEGSPLEFANWEDTPLYGQVERGEFWLQIARIEPDNSVLETVEAMAVATTKRKLVIVGNFTVDGYRDSIMKVISEHHLQDSIIFMKPVYNKPILNTIRSECFAYIHGHSVGGTNPSLLEIMEIGSPIFARNVPFNREVGGDTLLYYGDSGELAGIMNRVEIEEAIRAGMGKRARERVMTIYGWDSIIGDYPPIFK